MQQSIEFPFCVVKALLGFHNTPIILLCKATDCAKDKFPLGDSKVYSAKSRWRDAGCPLGVIILLTAKCLIRSNIICIYELLVLALLASLTPVALLNVLQTFCQFIVVNLIRQCDLTAVLLGQA